MVPFRSSSVPSEERSLNSPPEVVLTVGEVTTAMEDTLSSVASLDRDDALAKFLKVAESLTSGLREAMGQRNSSLSHRAVS